MKNRFDSSIVITDLYNQLTKHKTQNKQVHIILQKVLQLFNVYMQNCNSITKITNDENKDSTLLDKMLIDKLIQDNQMINEVLNQLTQKMKKTNNNLKTTSNLLTELFKTINDDI